MVPLIGKKIRDIYEKESNPQVFVEKTNMLLLYIGVYKKTV